MQVIETIEALRAARRILHGRVGVVPTMGALHEGHLSLARLARAENETVIVTIFVNPTQFAASEDLAKYPRTLAQDIATLEAAGVDVIFTPSTDLIYPSGYQTYVEVEQVTQRLEGAIRPGHFRGVATVVAKLFNLTQPTTAYFGQKDAQQVVVIRRMAADLNFPLEITVCPTIREFDGLAMSSRNVYLSPEQRIAAPALCRAMIAAAETYEAGEREPERLRALAASVLAAEPLIEPEYISLAHPATLVEAEAATNDPLLLSLAARLGTTRLLDNILLPARLNDRQGLTATLGVPA